MLQHLVPLLIILLTFGAFASERERGTLRQLVATGTDEVSPPDRAESTERLLADYGVERVEDLPINAVGACLQESEEFGNRIFDRNYGALWDTFRRQGSCRKPCRRRPR